MFIQHASRTLAVFVVVLLMLACSGLPTQGVPGGWTKVEIRDGVQRKAVCNNGEAAKYFARKGSGENSDRWLVFLKGGASCPTNELCEERWDEKRHLMKPPTDSVVDVQGIFNPDEERNPDFHNWNQIWVWYCSSDYWTGDRDASDATNNYHFRGSRIVDALFEDLDRSPPVGMPSIANAKQVLFMGGSAGANGMKHSVDRVAKTLKGVDVRAVNDSEFFVAMKSEYDKEVQKIWKQRIDLWSPVLDSSCQGRESSPHLCYEHERMVSKYIETPLFMYMDQRDTSALRTQRIERESADGERFAAETRRLMSGCEAGFSSRSGTHVLVTKPNFHDMEVKHRGKKYSYADVLASWAYGRNGPAKVVAGVK